MQESYKINKKCAQMCYVQTASYLDGENGKQHNKTHFGNFVIRAENMHNRQPKAKHAKANQNRNSC